jgi:hypothetical protein
LPFESLEDLDRPSSAAEVAAAQAEQKRQTVREHLVRAVGGPLEAFRFIDLSGSGNISQAEFCDGLQRLGVNWQEITGFSKGQEIFRLFDRNCNRNIRLEELFPEAYLDSEAASQRRMHRPSTAEFWDHWCKRTAKKDAGPRTPKWEPSSPDEVLLSKADVMCEWADQRQEIDHEQRRIAAMIRRMKKLGKSDSQCREIIATHLPRGSGPKDRQGVRAFSEVELRSCRRKYNDRTVNHVRNIQKNVHEMRELRNQLQGARVELRRVLPEDAVRTKKEHLAGLHLFGSPAASEGRARDDSAGSFEEVSAAFRRTSSDLRVADHRKQEAMDQFFNAASTL